MLQVNNLVDGVPVDQRVQTSHNMGTFHFDLFMDVVAARPLPHSPPPPAPSPATTSVWEFNIVVAPHNVLSAVDNETAGGPQDSAVAEALQLQHHVEGSHAVCAQGGRRSAFAAPSSHYYIIAAGAGKGLFGPEVWLSLFLPFATKGESTKCFEQRFAFLIHADPRLLVVDYSAPYYQCR